MGIIKDKSRTLRRVFVKTSTRIVKHYTKKMPRKARSSDGAILHGVPRGNAVDISRLSKTQRRPQRPYGGNLSSKAMRALIVRKVREAEE